MSNDIFKHFSKECIETLEKKGYLQIRQTQIRRTMIDISSIFPQRKSWLFKKANMNAIHFFVPYSMSQHFQNVWGTPPARNCSMQRRCNDSRLAIPRWDTIVFLYLRKNFVLSIMEISRWPILILSRSTSHVRLRCSASRRTWRPPSRED